MSANKIAETSSSTGTGNITLAGAWSVPSSFITGNRTFNSFYGLNHYFPYMIQDQNGNWEKGVGYLSDAATLVRQSVIDNSAGTTALIDFPAGEKLVMVPTDAGHGLPQQLQPDASVRTMHQLGYTSNNRGLANNAICISTFVLNRPMIVESLFFDVSTAVASSSVRVGIYSVGKYAYNGMQLRLCSTQNTVDSSSTGIKECLIDAKLGAGVYMMAFASADAVSIRANAISATLDLGSNTGGSSNHSQSAMFTSTGAADNLPGLISGNTYSTSFAAVHCSLTGKLL